MHIGDASPSDPEQLCAVLQRVGSRDRLALAELYAATAGRIFGMTMRVLRDPGFAEDVTQEVYLEVWDKANTFDARRGSALAWLITLAHRRAIDRVRSEQSRIERDDRNAALTARRCYDDEVATVVISELSDRRVRDCLECLTDLQREAITLAYIDRMTYRETAAALRIPVPTAKSRIREGLTRLRRELDGELVRIG